MKILTKKLIGEQSWVKSCVIIVSDPRHDSDLWNPSYLFLYFAVIFSFRVQLTPCWYPLTSCRIVDVRGAYGSSCTHSSVSPSFSITLSSPRPFHSILVRCQEFKIISIRREIRNQHVEMHQIPSMEEKSATSSAKSVSLLYSQVCVCQVFVLLRFRVAEILQGRKRGHKYGQISSWSTPPHSSLNCVDWGYLRCWSQIWCSFGAQVT